MIYCHLGYAAWLMSSLTRVSAIDLDINSTGMLPSTKVSYGLAHELIGPRINSKCCDNPSHEPSQQFYHRRQREPSKR